MKVKISKTFFWKSGSGVWLLIACLLWVGIAGCAPVATQAVPTVAPSPLPTATIPAQPTLPSGWQTDTPQQACGFSISHPAEMQGASEGTYSWMVRTAAQDPEQAARNFIYVTAIPADFQGGPGDAYNYDPAEADLLLNLQIGEAKPLHDNPDTAQWFTYTRQPDATLSDQVVQAYENTQPWEFPAGTKEIRYYLKTENCTYQIGGYLDTTGSSQEGAISEDLFNQIIGTFEVTP